MEYTIAGKEYTTIAQWNKSIFYIMWLERGGKGHSLHLLPACLLIHCSWEFKKTTMNVWTLDKFSICPVFINFIVLTLVLCASCILLETLRAPRDVFFLLSPNCLTGFAPVMWTLVHWHVISGNSSESFLCLLCRCFTPVLKTENWLILWFYYAVNLRTKLWYKPQSLKGKKERGL